MKKQRIIVEYELKSNSPAIIWRHLSTAEGLARWIADEVEMDENTVTLAWGNPLMHYDSRKLDILERTKNSCMRMRWVDEDDPEAEVMICACSAVEELIRRANGKAYDEISDARRYLKNARVA